MELQYEEWCRQGVERFGTMSIKWWYRCPECGTPHSLDDWILLGLTMDDALSLLGYSCLGVLHPDVGCQFSLRQHPDKAPVKIKLPDGMEVPVFDFVEEDI